MKSNKYFGLFIFCLSANAMYAGGQPEENLHGNKNHGLRKGAVKSAQGDGHGLLADVMKGKQKGSKVAPAGKAVKGSSFLNNHCTPFLWQTSTQELADLATRKCVENPDEALLKLPVLNKLCSKKEAVDAVMFFSSYAMGTFVYQMLGSSSCVPEKKEIPSVDILKNGATEAATVFVAHKIYSLGSFILEKTGYKAPVERFAQNHPMWWRVPRHVGGYVTHTLIKSLGGALRNYGSQSKVYKKID